MGALFIVSVTVPWFPHPYNKSKMSQPELRGLDGSGILGTWPAHRRHTRKCALTNWRQAVLGRVRKQLIPRAASDPMHDHSSYLGEPGEQCSKLWICSSLHVHHSLYCTCTSNPLCSGQRQLSSCCCYPVLAS